MDKDTLKQCFTKDQLAELLALTDEYFSQIDYIIPKGLGDVFPGYQQIAQLRDDLFEIAFEDTTLTEG